jgi:uncharacterized membrane protein YbhN (UPF0104 family)
MILPWQVHLGCAALVAADLAARSWRLRVLTASAGYTLRPVEALRANLLADAGAVLSPMRVGGEPARVAGLAATGMRMPAIAATIGWELVTAWPTLLGMGAILAAVAAPEWIASAGPRLAERVAASTSTLLLLAVVMVVACIAANGLRRRIAVARGGRMAEYAAPWRGMRRTTLLTSVALSAVNVGARTALLPVLAMGLASPPAPEVVWLGSFALIYGQLIFPTPGGVGAVEFGLAGGAAGDLGGDLGVLLAWRWWATLLPALLGLLAAWELRGALRGLVRPR